MLIIYLLCLFKSAKKYILNKKHNSEPLIHPTQIVGINLKVTLASWLQTLNVTNLLQPLMNNKRLQLSSHTKKET